MKITKKFQFTRNGINQSFSREIDTDEMDEETGLPKGDIQIHHCCPYCNCGQIRLIKYEDQVAVDTRKGKRVTVVCCNNCERSLDNLAMDTLQIKYKEEFS